MIENNMLCNSNTFDGSPRIGTISWAGEARATGRAFLCRWTSLASQGSQKSLQFHQDILWFSNICKPTLSSLSLQTGKGTSKLGEFFLHEFPQQKGTRSARACWGHYRDLESELLKSRTLPDLLFAGSWSGQPSWLYNIIPLNFCLQPLICSHSVTWDQTKKFFLGKFALLTLYKYFSLY